MITRDVEHPATTTSARFTMRLDDGRQLACADYGDPSGTAVLVLHGTPGWGSQAQLMHEAMRAAGVRLLAPDRPGCGLSDNHPALTFLDYSDDLRQLLDHLQLDSITVAGISGGGAFALACGYALPTRFHQVVLLAGMVPTPTPWRKALGFPSRLTFFLAAHWPWLAATLMTSSYPESPSHPMVKRMMRQLPEADQRVMRRTDVQALFFGDDARRFFKTSVRAAVHELALHSRPLGFSLGDITVPVRIMQGTEDTNVPPCIAHYLAEHIPGAELEFVPEAAHLFMLESPGHLLKFL